MPNTYALTDWVTMETLRLLLNKLEVGQFFNTDYNKNLTMEYPVGETFNVKLPQMFEVTTGLAYQPQAIDRRTTPVTCNIVKGVHFEWDSIEQALKLERGEEEIKKQYLEPAAAALKQELDSQCALWAYQNTPNAVGTLGTNPTSFDATSAAARERLIQMACPPSGEKGMIVPPAYVRALKNASIGYFNPASDISKQYKEGSIGRADGFDWYESMSLYDHTSGIWAGAVTITTSGLSGSSITVTCTTGDTVKKGDVISIDNVYAVNPMTRRTVSQTFDKQFVVTQDATGVASSMTIQISPSIVGPGSPYQNVDALPVAGAALSLFNDATPTGALTGKQGLALHKNAFALVSVKFQNPKAVEIASQSRDPETGVSIAFVRAFDPIQRRMVNRFDMCFGFGNLYNDSCAVRVLGAS